MIRHPFESCLGVLRRLRQTIARRALLAGAMALAAVSAQAQVWPAIAQESGGSAEPIAIGSRRELFIDDYLIDRLEGRAEQRLQQPQPRDLAIEHDAAWEGSGCGYHSVFQDGGRYRMYYKAWHLDVSSGKMRTDAHPLFLCYAESDDGIRWRKPELGLHAFQGSKANNIVLTPEQFDPIAADPGHAAVFKDDNPDAPADARYKAIIRSRKPVGLLAFQSPDGLHWSPMSKVPVITDGAFDSQNLAFWDAVRGE